MERRGKRKPSTKLQPATLPSGINIDGSTTSGKPATTSMAAVANGATSATSSSTSVAIYDENDERAPMSTTELTSQSRGDHAAHAVPSDTVDAGEEIGPIV
jgi:hypothetical protein